MNRLLRLGILLTGMLIFAIGCSASQNSGPAAPAPAVQAPAAQAPTVSAPASVPTAAVAPTIASNSTSGSNSIKLVIVQGKSEARYRVREQLANVSLPSDAIGRTQAVEGAIVGKPDGSIDPSQSKFTVDLSTLQSDRSQRDNFLRQNVLQTNQFRYATFVPTSATGLSLTMPPTGPQSFQLAGDLTIRNVTKPITWDINCDAPTANQGTCHATTSFKFEDFSLTQPRVSIVLSIVDNITLEADLVLQSSGS